jgi:hypothetical protein
VESTCSEVDPRDPKYVDNHTQNYLCSVDLSDEKLGRVTVTKMGTVLTLDGCLVRFQIIRSCEVHACSWFG